MKHATTTLSAFALLILTAVFVGCIRDSLQPCPPLALSLEVTDKNYTNIKAASRIGLEQERAEDLPFREYVHNLCYRLTDANSGEIVLERSMFEVEGDNGTQNIIFPEELPFGKYVFTVWGNVDDAQSLDDSFSSLCLQTSNILGDDVYMASDTLLYDHVNYSYTMGMERVKGKLIVEIKDMPDDFGFSSISASDILEYVNSEWKYSGLTSISSSHVWEQPVYDLYKMVSAPSVADGATEFILRAYSGTNDKGFCLESEPVQISLRRNELTIMRFVYEVCCCRFKIYVLVNDNWETLHSMEIV